MKVRKALGLDGIPVEVWKCMGGNVLSCLIKLFHKIIRTKKIVNGLRKTIVMPFNKNNGYIHGCTNYV